MFRKIIKYLVDNQDEMAKVGGVVGANVGVYLFSKDSPNFDPSNYAAGAIMGGAVGVILGITSPIVVPALAIGSPGYLAATLHSSLRESQQKEGTPVK